MTLPQQIITIALCALGTQMTRFLPFLILNEPSGGVVMWTWLLMWSMQ